MTIRGRTSLILGTSCCLMVILVLVGDGWAQMDGGHSRTAIYSVRSEKGVMAPMRDGVRLSTDLYFPEGATEPLPTILVRTPYSKAGGNRVDVETFVGQGYVVAMQDIRGRFESEGRYVVHAGDRNDGYDTVEWLSTRPWSSGKVATFGCSYRGGEQLELMAARHPNHVAAVPMAPSGTYYAPGRPWASFDGGAFELAQTAGWFMSNPTKVFYGPPSWVDREEWFGSESAELFRTGPESRRLDRLGLYWTLPIIDVVRKSGAPGTDYEDYVSNTPEAEYFRELDLVRADDRFDTAALYVDSWYDFAVGETLMLFNQMRENALSETARDNQFIIVAPTTHCSHSAATDRTIVGERDLGDARKGFVDLYLDWFDYWLKGIDNGVTEMPRVNYYLMGKNEWRTADTWPPAGTGYRKLYLHSGGGANSRLGDGLLSASVPGEEPADGFTYDPATPVMSLGGQACCTGMSTGQGGYDQSVNEMRHDVLVYTSEALDEGIEVSGPLEVVLYVGSSAKDTDFTAKLIDVYPDGRAFNVQEGALRMRYREGFDKKVWMREGEVHEAHLDLHATSNYFGPGHRVRLEVSSSNFPRFSRNMNTGGDNFDETEWVLAHNSVHHSAEYPSHVILPIVE